MGMDANLICMGEFSPDLAKYMDYKAEDYASTKPGTTVVATVFQCATTGQSEGLAECLGFQPWDFNKHVFDLTPDNLSNKQLKFLIETFGEHEVERFLSLIGAGFLCIYCPNG